MTFRDYVENYYNVTDWENYWSDFDESQILGHYVEFLSVDELADYNFSLEILYEMKSPEIEEHFYNAFYAAYGNNIPFYVVVNGYGDDVFIDFMHEFYYTYAEKSGYLVYPSEVPAVTADPEVTLSPASTPALSPDAVQTFPPKPSEVVTPETVTGGSASAVDRIYEEVRSQTIIMTMILFCIVFFWCEKKIKNAVRGFQEWKQS